MLLLLPLLAVPAAEIFIFIEIGGIIGSWSTIGLILGTALAGGTILRFQGLRTLARARAQLARQQLPVAEIADGAMLVIAAVCLLTPGFFTDALGVLLLFPWLRRAIARFALRRVRAAQSGKARGGEHGKIIEGEFSEVDGDDDDPPRLDKGP